MPRKKTPQFGDIIFFHPRSLKSKIITHFDDGDWSHVGLVLDIYESRILFIESHWDGVRIQLLDETSQNFTIVPAPVKIKKSKQELLQFVGKKYDYKHLVSMGLHLGSRKRIKLRSTNEDQLICSELVNWVYDYTLSPKGEATPNSIYRFLTQKT